LPLPARRTAGDDRRRAARYHLELLAEIAESFLLVADGSVTPKPDLDSLLADAKARA
jgi:hypothetical protein